MVEIAQTIQVGKHNLADPELATKIASGVQKHNYYLATQ